VTIDPVVLAMSIALVTGITVFVILLRSWRADRRRHAPRPASKSDPH
jgi:hypothetical protein